MISLLSATLCIISCLCCLLATCVLHESWTWLWFAGSRWGRRRRCWHRCRRCAPCIRWGPMAKDVWGGVCPTSWPRNENFAEYIYSVFVYAFLLCCAELSVQIPTPVSMLVCILLNCIACMGHVNSIGVWCRLMQHHTQLSNASCWIAVNSSAL